MPKRPNVKHHCLKQRVLALITMVLELKLWYINRKDNIFSCLHEASFTMYDQTTIIYCRLQLINCLSTFLLQCSTIQWRESLLELNFIGKYRRKNQDGQCRYKAYTKRKVLYVQSELTIIRMEGGPTMNKKIVSPPPVRTLSISIVQLEKFIRKKTFENNFSNNFTSLYSNVKLNIPKIKELLSHF